MRSLSLRRRTSNAMSNAAAEQMQNQITQGITTLNVVGRPIMTPAVASASSEAAAAKVNRLPFIHKPT